LRSLWFQGIKKRNLSRSSDGVRSSRHDRDRVNKKHRLALNLAFYKRLGGHQIMAEPITLGSATVDQIAYLWDDISGLSQKSWLCANSSDA
jgi:hypothetical protein